jgi:hypothetical protein
VTKYFLKINTIPYHILYICAMLVTFLDDEHNNSLQETPHGYAKWSGNRTTYCCSRKKINSLRQISSH